MRVERVKKQFLFFGACGALLALAFLLPMTWAGVILEWVAIVLLVWCLKKYPGQLLRSLFVCGVVSYLIGFYWLPRTIEFFGGFEAIVACSLFFLFCAVSSLQFILWGWLYQRLQSTILYRNHLALALSWLTVEFLFPKLFPWRLSSSQIRWTSFASLAEFVGTVPLSAILIWWADLLTSAFFDYWSSRGPEAAAGYQPLLPKRHLIFALSFTLLLLGIGAFRTAQVHVLLSQAPRIQVALIQGNLDAKQKGDIRYFQVNLNRYRELSEQAIQAGAEFVLWPESVSNIWTPETLKSVTGTVYDPFPHLTVPLLYGGLSCRKHSWSNSSWPQDNAAPELEDQCSSGDQAFNTAFGRDSAGKMVGRYHKKILMPFGEYLPFADRFPWLKTLSPKSGDFSRGDLDNPIVFEVKSKFEQGQERLRQLSVSTLICYEDLLSSLSKDAVRHGAEILVNLTNDVWYGDTKAPYQHHLLAAWRAIETRRYLVRVTNTGLTGVVDPLGRTIEMLPIFTSGVLLAEIRPLTIRTLSVKLGDWHLWVLSLGTIVLAFVKRRECGMHSIPSADISEYVKKEKDD